MAKNVILPALGMAQETGKIVRWLKTDGEQVTQGEPLVEIETDKATVEIEAPTSGILANSAPPDKEIPVGQSIALIIDQGEVPPQQENNGRETKIQPSSATPTGGTNERSSASVSPLAARIAAEHNLDINTIRSGGRRIQKADVLAHLQSQEHPVTREQASEQTATSLSSSTPHLLAASPKARRLAREQGKALATIRGTGPDGAVLVADILKAPLMTATTQPSIAGTATNATHKETREIEVSRTWRIMADRTTQSWTSTPHFFLHREVNASRLIIWRENIQKRSPVKITITDLLVKVVAAALREHPRLNASWQEGRILQNNDIHIGLAVATEEGLIVPVIHHANTLRVAQIAEQRQEKVARTRNGQTRIEDLTGGTFTISNLGMFGIDGFQAIINPPQVAILAVGRIADRVVAVAGQPIVQPMMEVCLSCDHRAVDGARGAQFLANLADLLEEPLGLLG